MIKSIHYTINCKNPGQKFLNIHLSIDLAEEVQNIEFFLPRWRPGRYEIGNFAKNVKGFKAQSGGESLLFSKENQSCWTIEVAKRKKIEVSYEYYAAQYDAGSTWVDHTQIYINPVNCFLYSLQESSAKISLEMKVAEDYIFATSLKNGKEKNLFIPESFDELFDSPIVASSQIKHASYEVEGIEFHVWFIGECKPDWKKIIQDFSAFTKEMYLNFGEFPFDTFHFLIHALPAPAYHGVEHLKSTVITLGPGYDLMSNDGYQKLIGISSHELYHAWNVKTIRPKAMVPYDYQTENYTIMGYLTEGVTSYMGDLFLAQSGVVSNEKFLSLMEETLARHTGNDGRFYYSVTESSFDTWLDGYALGVPNRKTSIYVEGAILSWILDLEIIKQTKGNCSLHDLMKDLFVQFGLEGKGVANEDFIALADKYTNGSFSNEIWQFYDQPNDLVELLQSKLDYFGVALVKKSETPSRNQLGVQFYPSSSKILKVAKDSPAAHAGLSMDDEIIAVNHLIVSNNAEQWIDYFEGEVELEIKKAHHVFRIGIRPSPSKTYFPSYIVKTADSAPKVKSERFKDWMAGKPVETD